MWGQSATYHQIGNLPSVLLSDLSSSGIKSLNDIPGLLFQFQANSTDVNNTAGEVNYWLPNLGGDFFPMTTNLSNAQVAPIYTESDPLMNGHPSVSNPASSGETAEMDSEIVIDWTYDSMTFAMVGYFDIVNSPGDGRFSSCSNQGLGLDDWVSDLTCIPAYADGSGGVSADRNSNVVGNDSVNYGVPCIVISSFDSSIGGINFYYQAVGSNTLVTTFGASGTTSSFNIDTYSILANLLQDNGGFGSISLHAGWNRALMTSEIISAANFLSELYS